MNVAEGSALDRIMRQGPRGSLPHDLMAVMVSREARDVAANEAAVRDRFKGWSLARFADIAPADLCSDDSFGIEAFEATRLICAVALGHKAAIAKTGPRVEATSYEGAAALFRHLEGQSQEHFCAAYFDSKMGLVSVQTIHIGTLNMSVVGAREVFREAVRLGAASVIVAHNHPSGDPTPSHEDLQVTRTLAEAGKLLDVQVADHLVIGSNGAFYSFAEHGLV